MTAFPEQAPSALAGTAMRAATQRAFGLHPPGRTTAQAGGHRA